MADGDDDPLTLRCGRATLAVSRRGGCIARYAWTTDGGAVDWLRPGPSDATDPLAMACFPLVPYSNRIRDGRFSFDGDEVVLPPTHAEIPHAIHGHGWQSDWQVSNRGAAAVSLVYERAADAWPCAYRARQDFRLTERELAVALELENLGSRPMPAGLGLHPYIPRHPHTRLKAQVERVWLTDTEVMPTELATPPDRWQLSEGVEVEGLDIDNAFTGWAGHATIEWPNVARRLEIFADPAFRFLVVYAPPGADFFCVEPASHCTDAFNLAATGRDDTGMAVLAPGERLAGTVRFVPTLPD